MGGAPAPIRWISEAERLTPAGTYGPMSGKGGPRATLHCTVSAPTQFADMHRVLTSKKAEPHLLYSFADDRLGQYFPLDVSARALMGSGAVPSGVSHNKVGTVNIQIEVVGSTDDWSARPDWQPGPNFRAMMSAIASWGITPEFIYRPATTATDRANVVRSFSTMVGSAGGGKWWGHCHYPDGESHWDPGRIDPVRFFAAATSTTPAPVQQEDEVTQAQIDEIVARTITGIIYYKNDITQNKSLLTHWLSTGANAGRAVTGSAAATDAIVAFAAGFGPEVEARVRKALEDAVVDVNVNFPVTADEPPVVTP